MFTYLLKITLLKWSVLEFRIRDSFARQYRHFPLLAVVARENKFHVPCFVISLSLCSVCILSAVKIYRHESFEVLVALLLKI